jgi:hypothetical protein
VNVNKVCKPALELKCLPGDGQNIKNCAFDWKVVYKKETKELIFNFDFTDYKKVSKGNEPDQMIFNFWGAFLLRDSQG